MLKKLQLKLNRYSPIPATLRSDPAVDVASPEITVDLARLYHHYFLDSFDTAPPNPDPAQFEHVQFLLPTEEFRFQGDGLGASPAIRRHRSNELGQAFCRWLLYEHLDVTYFAHVERLLDRQAHRPFDGCALHRIASGDAPDYLCATAQGAACLAEAKGRYSSIGFNTKEFARWREQFSRVAFKDASGVTRRLKGHIVATRFSTESDSARLKSTILAEDPLSPGDRDFEREESSGLSQAVQQVHYAGIALKLRQPVLASALLNGVPMPEELRVVGMAWRVLAGPLQGRRFVGGYYAADGREPTLRRAVAGVVYSTPNPFRLDLPSFTFFGLEEEILRQVVRLARTSQIQPQRIGVLEATEFFYSGFSVLRDGSAVAPLDFFMPEEQVIL